jgi:outer membrane receptor for ferrienterochelin and colicin
MLRSLILFCLLLFSGCAFGQNGTIAGVVTDAATGETVIGANVVIQGTTIGAATDLDGKFSIANVKPGTYNLSVTFITYKAHVIPDVVVEAAKISEIKVRMHEDVSELQEVVITGTRQINNDFALLKAIKESKLVVSGISAEQISRSQDRDAAQVVRRVPGVTLQDNRFVVVRGLSSRYSNVMLNGVLAPSMEADSRAFSFDIIPSGLLDRMLVYKSGSAELPGDFAGSVIQVNTKSTFDENFTNVSFGTGYRFNTTFTNRQSQQRAATEWLGFDNGFRSLPDNAPTNYALSGTNVAKIEAESRKFNNSWGLEQLNVSPDMRFNIDLGRTFEIKNVSVSAVNGITYSNTNQFNRSQLNRYQNYDPVTFLSEDVFRYNDDQLANDVRLGLLSNWTVKYSNKSIIEVRNLYNRLGTTQTTIRDGVNDFRQQHYRNYSMRYVERSIYSGQVEGKHELKEDRSKIAWLLGYSSAKRSEPDWKRLVTARAIGAGDETPFIVVIPTSTSASNAARFYQELDEYNLTNRLDFDYKFNRGNEDKDAVELKAGYWIEYKDRTFAARSIGHVVREGFDQQGPIGTLPFDEIFGAENVNYQTGHHIAENTKISDAYAARNLLTAGYLSFNLPLSEKLRVIPGVRVEHNRQQLNTALGTGAVAVDNPITSVLPSLNVSYNLNATSLVRLAYSQTINRPEFRELAPFTFYDFENQADILGNDSLKVANIHNVDLRWEYYPAPGESVSAGVFYKYFNNPIETTIDNGTDNPVFLYNNAANAQNVGLEIEVRKTLAYTSPSRFLNRTSLVLNAAYIVSEINLQNDGTLLEKESRPMQGQSPYIINAGVFYNDDEHGFHVNAQYNIFGKRIAFVGLPGLPTWWEMPRHMMDITVSKSLNKRAVLRLGVSDLLNARSLFREDANLDNKLKDAATNKVVRSTYNGQYVTLGLSFKL